MVRYVKFRAQFAQNNIKTSVWSERIPHMNLTKNEIEIMDVLWREDRPLSRGEILSLSVDKTWMDSSIHILLNSMLRKGAIVEAGFVKCGKTCGRTYGAALSVEEYIVSTFDHTKAVPEFVEVLRAYIDKVGLSLGEIKEMEKLLKETKQNLKDAK